VCNKDLIVYKLIINNIPLEVYYVSTTRPTLLGINH